MLTAKIEHNATHVSLLKKIVNTYCIRKLGRNLHFSPRQAQDSRRT